MTPAWPLYPPEATQARGFVAPIIAPPGLPRLLRRAELSGFADPKAVGMGTCPPSAPGLTPSLRGVLDKYRARHLKSLTQCLYLPDIQLSLSIQYLGYYPLTS